MRLRALMVPYCVYIYIYIRTVIYIYNLFSAVRQTPASQLQAAAAAQPPQYMTLQTDRSVVVRSPLCRSLWKLFHSFPALYHSFWELFRSVWSLCARLNVVACGSYT
jgi:hypothetical protein